MSSHFSANQYNEPFWPKRLRNWQYGVNHPGTYPRARYEPTRPITDENGRFLPGVKPSSVSSPWGDYQGWIWEASPTNACACVDRLRRPQHYNMPTSTIIVARHSREPTKEAELAAAALAPQFFHPRPEPQLSMQMSTQQNGPVVRNSIC